MILPLIQLTAEIICINYFVKDLINNGNYAAVINLQHNFDFLTLRINRGSIQKLDRIPKAYIMDLDEMKIEEFLKLRTIYGFCDDTKYIFLGEHITSLMGQGVTPEFMSNSVFIDVNNGDVHTDMSKEPRGLRLDSINVDKSGNCNGDLTNVHSSRKSIKLKEGTKLRICLYRGPPYSICSPDDGCKEKGIEIEFWQLILGMLNATADISIRTFPWENHRDMEYKVLYNGSCDTHSGEYFSDGTLDITIPFFFDSIHWVVETPRQKPRWKYAFEIFTLDIWIFWLVSSICLSFTLYMTEKVGDRAAKITDGLLIISKHMLEQAQVLKPSTLPQLVTLCTILLSTFLMNLFYDTKFTFLLTGFKDSFSMSSTEDIMQNNYRVVSYDVILTIFSEDERVLNYLRDHLEKRTFNLDAVQEDVAILELKRIFLYQIKNYLDIDKRPKLKLLEEAVFTRAFCNVLRRGDPLTRLVNQKMISVIEHGFSTRITSKYKTFEHKGESRVEVRRLTLGSLQLPNALWVLGMILSLAAIFYESR